MKQNAQVLLWSLNGTMRYLPVAALWDGEKYLVERYQNVVFTRAETKRLTRRVSPHWTGVGFGTSKAHDVDLLGDRDKIHLPALPGMTEELTGIFKRQPAGKTGVVAGEVFTDRRFTKSRFYGAMKKRRPLVHISSHFSFYPGDDSRSFLLLGNGEPLTLSEIKKRGGLFEKVQLLTLSACKTAASQPDSFGKEIDGFAELAQRLGANAVMATLWEVREGSTARLMKDFYRGRQTKGLTKAEALQQAQLDLLYGTDKVRPTAAVNQVRVPCRAGSSVDIHVEKKYRVPFESNGQNCFAHPYYWSPFILFGNWR
jgi:CHAT domain-containing protein